MIRERGYHNLIIRGFLYRKCPPKVMIRFAKVMITYHNGILIRFPLIALLEVYGSTRETKTVETTVSFLRTGIV